MADSPHIPVLLQEVKEQSNLRPGSLVIDGTVGFGGHAEELISLILPSGKYLGVDKDHNAVRFTTLRLQKYGHAAVVVQGQFSNLYSIAKENDFDQVDLVLLDLGLSSFQVDEQSYGISFSSDQALDMRIGIEEGVSAFQIINNWPAADLRRLFTKHGQEATNRLVAEIIKVRDEGPINSTKDLVSIIERIVPKHPGINPATKVFQALRVEANREEEELAKGLEQAVLLLKTGGRLLVISFHSLEDGAVKAFMNKESKDCICPPTYPVCVCGHRASIKMITKKPIEPSEAEVSANPRARSAKLRVAQKI